MRIRLIVVTCLAFSGIFLLYKATWWKQPLNMRSAAENHIETQNNYDNATKSQTSAILADQYDSRFSRLETEISEIKESLALITEMLDEKQGPDITYEATHSPNIESNNSYRSSREERQQLLETSLGYNTDSNDGWPENTEIEIDRIITGSDKLAAAESQYVQCADKMCKIEVVLPADMDSFNKDFYATELLQSVADRLPRGTYETIFNPDGSQRLVFYLARAGYKLLTVDDPLGSSTTTGDAADRSRGRK